MNRNQKKVFLVYYFFRSKLYFCVECVKSTMLKRTKYAVK